MKPFRFRLEKILGYKRQIEDRKKQTLAKRNNELNLEISRLRLLIDRDKSYRAKYAELFKGKMNITRLRFSRGYLDRLNKEITVQTEQVNKSREKVNRAKAILREAMRDRKKYEKLKERRKLEHYYEAGRAEQKDLDEIGIRPRTGKLTMGTVP